MVSPTRNKPRRQQSAGPAALHWILHINTRLADGSRVTAVSLAAELEFCARAIKRAIATLRDEHGVKILWQTSTDTHFYEPQDKHYAAWVSPRICPTPSGIIMRESPLSRA